MSTLKDAGKLRRVYDEHVARSSASRGGRVPQTSVSASTAMDGAGAHPIADHFMRKPAMPAALPPRDTDYSNEQASIPRKPLPSSPESQNTSAHRSPRPDTIRRVPTADQESSSEVGEDDSDDFVDASEGEDDLAPAMSRLDMSGSAPALSRRDMGSRMPRASLDKPLPSPPSTQADFDMERQSELRASDLAVARGGSVRDLERELGVSGKLDLSDTADTTVHTHWAPAITRNTITQNVHEIREERITREIHQDHVYHRILPVEEVEVLPARHYVQVHGGKYQEIPEEQLPGRANKRAQRMIEKGIKKALLPKDGETSGPRQFSAREFPGTEGDYREGVTPEGTARSEQYWVHSPTVSTGGRDSGQTLPFHLGSADPMDDGLRT